MSRASPYTLCMGRYAQDLSSFTKKTLGPTMIMAATHTRGVLSSTRAQFHLSAAAFSLGGLVGHVAVSLPDREREHSLNQLVESFGLAFLLLLRGEDVSSLARLDQTTAKVRWSCMISSTPQDVGHTKLLQGHFSRTLSTAIPSRLAVAPANIFSSPLSKMLLTASLVRQMILILPRKQQIF